MNATIVRPEQPYKSPPAGEISHFARHGLAVLVLSAMAGSVSEVFGESPPAESRLQRRPPQELLGDVKWLQIEASIDRGLSYLVRQQRKNGSFESPDSGQPGITGLCVLAFLSRGHLPDQGPHGAHLSKAIDFVLSCQGSDGMLSLSEPEPRDVHAGASHAGNYNHAIAGLMLSEVYGACRGDRHDRIRTAIEKALVFLRQEQVRPKRQAADAGGWRYIRPQGRIDADLSATAWALMFMRSARNAEFDVPKEHVDAAMAYVRSCFDAREKTFFYGHSARDRTTSRGLAGGGIVSLALGGEHNSEMAKQAGDWLLGQSFEQYNRGDGPYHYGAYYASQGMFQLGGEYWEKFYPPLADALTEFQRANGSWDIREQHQRKFIRQFLHDGALDPCSDAPLSIVAGISEIASRVLRNEI